MAFALRNLSVLAYANGFTLRHYKAANDNFATLGEPGYFGQAADLMAEGDMVLISGTLDGARVAAVEGAGPALALSRLA